MHHFVIPEKDFVQTWIPKRKCLLPVLTWELQKEDESRVNFLNYSTGRTFCKNLQQHVSQVPTYKKDRKAK